MIGFIKIKNNGKHFTKYTLISKVKLISRLFKRIPKNV